MPKPMPKPMTELKKQLPPQTRIPPIVSHILNDLPQTLAVEFNLSQRDLQAFLNTKLVEYLQPQPQKAKKISGYNLFCMEQRHTIVRAHPNLKPAEVMKKLGEAWKQANQADWNQKAKLKNDENGFSSSDEKKVSRISGYQLFSNHYRQEAQNQACGYAGRERANQVMKLLGSWWKECENQEEWNQQAKEQNKQNGLEITTKPKFKSKPKPKVSEKQTETEEKFTEDEELTSEEETLHHDVAEPKSKQPNNEELSEDTIVRLSKPEKFGGLSLKDFKEKAKAWLTEAELSSITKKPQLVKALRSKLQEDSGESE